MSFRALRLDGFLINYGLFDISKQLSAIKKEFHNVNIYLSYFICYCIKINICYKI
jgi:hypothetical protein